MKIFYERALLLIIVLAGFSAQSQNNPIHWSLTIEQCTQVASNQLEFSLYMQFDGTTPNIELLSYAFGINYNAAIFNGGKGSCTQIFPRDPLLKPLPKPVLAMLTGTKVNGLTETNQIRLTQGVSFFGSGVHNINPSAPEPGTKLFLGRFQLTTSAASFLKNADAGLSIQCSQRVGRTNFSVIYDIGGIPPSNTATSFSKNPPQPAVSCHSLSDCSGLILKTE